MELDRVYLTGSGGFAVRLWGLRIIEDDGNVVLVVAKQEERPSICNGTGRTQKSCNFTAFSKDDCPASG